MLRTNKIEGIFITDTHLTLTSNVRIDEDYLGSILNKFRFVLDECKRLSCPLFIGGDVFDKPTIPDIAKNRFISLLKDYADIPVITIWGNHDVLYANHDNDSKTTLQLFANVGLLRVFHDEGFDWEDSEGFKVYVNFSRPMGSHGLPQLGIYHGFLNNDTDKYNQFFFQDIDHNDPSLVFLGHDHVPYDDVEYSNATIVRPGSLVRAIRSDESNRTPQYVRFMWSKKQNKWLLKKVDIPCASSKLCFKEKKKKSESAEVSYESIIDQIKASSNDDLGFIEALSKIAPDNVVHYCESILNDIEVRRESK